MKKLLFVGTISFLTACNTFTSNKGVSVAADGSPTRQSFLGEWACQMDGGKIATSNAITLNADGSTTSMSKVSIPNDNPMFQYDVLRTGTWDYAKNKLTYRFTQGDVKRAHSEEIQQQLNSDKALSVTEAQYYELLTKQVKTSDQKPISIKVSHFTPNAFTIAQNVNQVARTGLCARPTK